VQFGIQRHEHLAQAAARVRSEDVKPLAIARGRAQGQTGGTIGIVLAVELGGMAVLGPCDTGERRLDLRLAQRRQAGARRSVGGDGGQALLRVTVMGLKVNLGQCVQERPLRGGQVAACLQMVGQALGLVECPGLKGKHELALVDQAVLKREQAEQEMAVRGHGSPPLHLRRRPDALAIEKRSVEGRMDVSARCRCYPAASAYGHCREHLRATVRCAQDEGEPTRWAANSGGKRLDPSHRRARQGVARARAGRYSHLTPVRPAADAVPQEADAALRRPDADLDGAR
jgi:hypothetical protein